MDLSVVIVTYRSRECIPECLRSLLAARGALEMECLIVENASGDGTPDMVRREFPGVRVLENRDNLGYAGGVNRGIRESTGRHVLVLNPDCVVEPDALTVLVGWLDAHPKTAIAAPQLRDGRGVIEYSARTYPSPWAFLFNRYSLLTFLWPGNPWSRRYLMSDWDHRSMRSVDWVVGAAMCVRRTAIAAVGEMDETYFMFNEDVDWCLRMTKAGWAVDYVPDARVLHHIGTSRKRTTARVIIERHKGMIHYFRKHHRAPWPVDAVVSAFIMFRAGLMLVRNALHFW